MNKKTRVLILFVIVIIFACAAMIYSTNLSYPMECTIYYVDESGNTLAQKVTGETNASNPVFNVTSPEIEGYGITLPYRQMGQTLCISDGRFRRTAPER